MRVNTEVTLSMVNDHHSAITRKALRENDFALLYCFNFLTDWGFDINSFAKHFGRKFWMSNFAETAGYFASNWPIEFAFHRLKPGAGGKFGRFSNIPSGHFIHHLLETKCSLLKLLEGSNATLFLLAETCKKQLFLFCILAD